MGNVGLVLIGRRNKRQPTPSWLEQQMRALFQQS